MARFLNGGLHIADRLAIADSRWRNQRLKARRTRPRPRPKTISLRSCDPYAFESYAFEIVEPMVDRMIAIPHLTGLKEVVPVKIVSFSRPRSRSTRGRCYKRRPSISSYRSEGKQPDSFNTSRSSRHPDTQQRPRGRLRYSGCLPALESCFYWRFCYGS